MKRDQVVLHGRDDSEGGRIRDKGGSSWSLLVVLVRIRVRVGAPVRYVGQVGYALQHGGRGRWRS